jgi:hypothetical protein
MADYYTIERVLAHVILDMLQVADGSHTKLLWQSGKAISPISMSFRRRPSFFGSESSNMFIVFSCSLAYSGCVSYPAFEISNSCT